MDWTAFRVSLHAALLATLIATAIGVTVGYLLAKTRFRGAPVVEAVLTLPMALPPTVMGYYLLTQLGGPGPVRDASVTIFGHPLVFTFEGVVVAQAVECMPFVLRAARGAIADVDPKREQAARVLGLPEWRVALAVTLPLARRGILAGVAMGFGRALGDYAATDAVSGYLPGTTTMSMAIYEDVFSGNLADARTLAYVQLAVAVLILACVSRLGKSRV